MHNLRQFLALLRREGELVTVDAPVSSDLEIAEIHRRVLAAAGPACSLPTSKARTSLVSPTSLVPPGASIWPLALGRNSSSSS